MRPSIRATTERRTAAPRMGGMGQRVYKPLLGVADTNHLLSIHIWVMLGNAEELIQVRKWLRVLLDPVPTCMYATKATTARVGKGVKMSNVATCPTVAVIHIGLSLSTLVMPKAPQYTHGSLQQLWGKLLNFSNLAL